MLKQGLFLYGQGFEYTVYEQIADGFTRLDFCTKNANFHTDIEAVKFSIVKQKDTFIYGDNSIYTKYMSLLDAAHQFNVREEVSHEWKFGKYYTRIIRAQPSSQFLEETIQCNGKPDSYTVQFGDSIFTINTIADYSSSKLLPLNYSEYTTVSLGATEVSSEAPYYNLSVLRARYDIAHLDECDFVVADDLQTARERLHRWLNADVPLKGIDTETTGTDVDMYGEDRLVGIVLSYDPTESTYFPFGHKKFDNLTEDFLQKELMPAIKKEEYRLVSHNKKFERKVFLHSGHSIYIKYDTLPLSCMVDPVIEKGAHELKTLMFRESGKVFLELEDIFVSPKLIDFSVLPKEIVRLYACPDSASLLYLYPRLWEKLPVYSRKITEVEYDLADVKADQEYYGLRVNVEKFMENLDNCDYTMNALLTSFRALTGIDGNINSTDVLSNLIFGRMSCPVLVRTKTGKPSTGAASIVKLAGMRVDAAREQLITEGIKDKNGKEVITAAQLNNAKYPALVILEKYRIYNKLRTAFYSRFERTKRSGRVFFWVNQNGASSGRQSSPMHQLPPELKDVIISDSPEHDMWDPDYSQIELRMIAFLAGETELIELCKDPENDIHRAIGSLISNKEMWEISAEERQLGKRRNFGVIYLISAFGLAAQIAGAGYSDEDVKRADKSLNEFFHRFKRIRKYIAQNAEKVQNQGFITTYFGRNKYFKEIFDPEITSRKRASLLRKANNLPVQGTAADYLKLAETNFNTYIRNKSWDVLMENGFPRVRVALSIHDEILLMADRSIPYEEILLMIRTCMEMPVVGAPPFFCSPSLVETWAQHDDDAVPVPIKLRDKLIEEYQQTGVSKINRDNYLSTLNVYREELLHDYMNDLISRYGTDPDVVAEHVRHPSLTHQLIARHRPPKGTKLSHIDCIRYATAKYISGERGTGGTAKETDDILSRVIGQEPLVNFDAKGKVVYEADEDSIDEDDFDPYDDEHFITQVTSGEKVYVWELMDALCVDISGLSAPVADVIIRKVWDHQDPNGFFRVLFIRDDLMLDGKFRVEDIDKIELTEFIKEVANGKVSSG